MTALLASGLPLARHRYLAMKRALDLVLVLPALVVLAPVLVCVALAVRLDSPGPVLYSQERTGRDGVRFRVWKFRTMVRNADELKEQLRHLSVVPAPDFKIPNDPRITRVGRFLRRTSLDELPQLYSVLRGDMSLVGPRPTSFGVSTYDLWHARRLEVRPGLTGLWQVTARGSVDFDERLRLDIEYIRNVSLGLDLRILARTAVAVVRGEGS